MVDTISVLELERHIQILAHQLSLARTGIIYCPGNSVAFPCTDAQPTFSNFTYGNVKQFKNDMALWFDLVRLEFVSHLCATTCRMLTIALQGTQHLPIIFNWTSSLR